MEEKLKPCEFCGDKDDHIALIQNLAGWVDISLNGEFQKYMEDREHVAELKKLLDEVDDYIQGFCKG